MPTDLSKKKMAWNKASGYKAQYKWNKEHHKQIAITLNVDTDADVIDWWMKKDKKAEWFRDAVRREIAKGSKTHVDAPKTDSEDEKA